MSPAGLLQRTPWSASWRDRWVAAENTLVGLLEGQVDPGVALGGGTQYRSWQEMDPLVMGSNVTLSLILPWQLSMLSGLFPRHVIEYFSTHAEAVPEHMGQLARTHEGVTILFMDIVGESARLHWPTSCDSRASNARSC